MFIMPQIGPRQYRLDSKRASSGAVLGTRKRARSAQRSSVAPSACSLPSATPAQSGNRPALVAHRCARRRSGRAIDRCPAAAFQRRSIAAALASSRAASSACSAGVPKRRASASRSRLARCRMAFNPTSATLNGSLRPHPRRVPFEARVEIDQRDHPLVEILARPHRGVDMAEILAPDRRGRRRADAGERRVPGRAVVHAGFPRVQHADEAAAVRIARADPPAMRAEHPRIERREVAFGQRLVARTFEAEARRRGEHRGLGDAGGRRRCGVRHTSGPGK